MILAAWLAHAHGLSLPVAAACVVCGVAGGLLPDVDSESSISTRLVFSIVAAAAALGGAGVGYHHIGGEYRLVVIGGGALLTFVFIRYVVSELFHAVTVHRGVIHSIPMAAACGLGLFHSILLVGSVGASVAMWPGIFVAGGFLVHLLLDELYSVDLQNTRLKRSFGTAMKLGSRSNLPGTIGLYVADLAMVVAALVLTEQL